MTSFAITLVGHCCRRRLVGQRVVSNISVVSSCLSRPLFVVRVLNLIIIIIIC